MIIATQHGGHLRPDRVWDTGVWEPYPIRQRNPVDVAQHTIDPFIGSVRPMALNVFAPSPEQVAQAAVAVAEQFRQGKPAGVRLGREVVIVDATSTPSNPLLATIVEAARKIANGEAVTVAAPGRQGLPAVTVRPVATASSSGGFGYHAQHPGNGRVFPTAGVRAVVTHGPDAAAGALRTTAAQQQHMREIVARMARLPTTPASPGRQPMMAAMAGRPFLQTGQAPSPQQDSLRAQLEATRARQLGGR
jgi:hypothetical protein